MANTRLEHGLDLWQEMAELQNQIMERDGSIEKNDPRLWQGYLHKWDNTEWILVLEAMLQLKQQHPELFKAFHEAALTDAIKALLAGEEESDRVLDKKANKAKAWKMIMTMREVWNNAQNAEARQPVKAAKLTASSQFSGLFEFQ